MILSKKILVSGFAIAALAAPALAQDHAMDKQQSQEHGLKANPGAIGPTKPTSGPGVQGFPDTRTGPATRAPGQNGTGANTGASSGEGGMSNPGTMNNSRRTTQPSQDSSGVQGFPDTRTGPSTRSPEDAPSGPASQ